MDYLTIAALYGLGVYCLIFTFTGLSAMVFNPNERWSEHLRGKWIQKSVIVLTPALFIVIAVLIATDFKGYLTAALQDGYVRWGYNSYSSMEDKLLAPISKFGWYAEQFVY